MKLGQLLQLRPHTAIEDLSDEGLAAACATGDRAAQGLLFERHVDAVHRFIARMRTSDPSAVDDLVQATFIAAFSSAHRFVGPKLSSWLYGIAVNVMRTYVRKEVARKRIAMSFAEQPAAEPVAPRDADAARVRIAIDSLSPKLRAVIVMIDLEGASGADVAAALRIPEGTVWRRLSDARAKLRDALGGDS
jgi:RNA polymerase sigma-70 factor (ECF subfamily)